MLSNEDFKRTQVICKWINNQIANKTITQMYIQCTYIHCNDYIY